MEYVEGALVVMADLGCEEEGMWGTEWRNQRTGEPKDQDQTEPRPCWLVAV